MKLFVSYRRKDVGHVAGRLRDRLFDEFGEANVFFDIDSIDPGQRFAEVISERLGKAEIVLVLIGPNWRPELLARPDDYVRLELAEALDQQKTVVPVLVDDGELPAIGDLPDEVASFVTHNAAKLRQDPDFHEDADRLIEGIKPSPGQTGMRTWMPPSPKVPGFGGVISLVVVLALLVGLATQALGPQSRDAASTDESAPKTGRPEPELLESVGDAPSYQPIVEVPVACAGGEVVFSAGPTEWRDVTGFRIPLGLLATGTDSGSQYEVEAFDPAGHRWPINTETFDAGPVPIGQGDSEHHDNVEGQLAGLQRDAIGIALVVTSNADCQEEFILLRVSLDPPS